jgi:hypothetical protein
MEFLKAFVRYFLVFAGVLLLSGLLFGAFFFLFSNPPWGPIILLILVLVLTAGFAAYQEIHT